MISSVAVGAAPASGLASAGSTRLAWRRGDAGRAGAATSRGVSHAVASSRDAASTRRLIGPPPASHTASRRRRLGATWNEGDTQGLPYPSAARPVPSRDDAGGTPPRGEHATSGRCHSARATCDAYERL